MLCCLLIVRFATHCFFFLINFEIVIWIAYDYILLLLFNTQNYFAVIILFLIFFEREKFLQSVLHRSNHFLLDYCVI